MREDGEWCLESCEREAKEAGGKLQEEPPGPPGGIVIVAPQSSGSPAIRGQPDPGGSSAPFFLRSALGSSATFFRRNAPTTLVAPLLRRPDDAVPASEGAFVPLSRSIGQSIGQSVRSTGGQRSDNPVLRARQD